MATFVAIAIISAQETIPGHSASKAAFKASMNSYPLTERLAPAFFSEEVPAIRIDASHPLKTTRLINEPTKWVV